MRCTRNRRAARGSAPDVAISVARVVPLRVWRFTVCAARFARASARRWARSVLDGSMIVATGGALARASGHFDKD